MHTTWWVCITTDPPSYMLLVCLPLCSLVWLGIYVMQAECARASTAVTMPFEPPKHGARRPHSPARRPLPLPALEHTFTACLHQTDRRAQSHHSGAQKASGGARAPHRPSGAHHRPSGEPSRQRAAAAGLAAPRQGSIAARSMRGRCLLWSHHCSIWLLWCSRRGLEVMQRRTGGPAACKPLCQPPGGLPVSWGPPQQGTAAANGNIRLGEGAARCGFHAPRPVHSMCSAVCCTCTHAGVLHIGQVSPTSTQTPLPVCSPSQALTPAGPRTAAVTCGSKVGRAGWGCDHTTTVLHQLGQRLPPVPCLAYCMDKHAGVEVG